MGLAMFLIFLFTNLSMVGIFAFVYAGKEQYSEGMILGVHIPESEKQHPEVQELGKKYKNSLKKFSIMNLVFGIAVCFLSFWNTTYFMFIWIFWLFLYSVEGMKLIYKTHRNMYDIKMKHNWLMGEHTHMIYIDTVVSSLTKKMPISHWWNLAAIIVLVILVCIPKVSNYFLVNPQQWVLPGVTGVSMILFWILHIVFVSKSNKVYSKDSSINLSMNQMEKRTWSVIWLSTNIINLLGITYLIVRIINNNWLNETDYKIYILLQILPAVVLLFGVMYIFKSRKQILSMDSEALCVDDDEYWKNGWYHNPQDKRLLVQDRLCSTNYSFNTGRPAAKVILGVTIAMTIAIIVGVFVLVDSLEHAEISVNIRETQVNIDSVMYDTSFDRKEIQSVKMIPKMPDDDFTRTNGGATEKFLIGHFNGRKTGKCMLYLYRHYTPVLEIKLVEKTIYLNSKDEKEVREWYDMLKNH